jgi:hypothetical protein
MGVARGVDYSFDRPDVACLFSVGTAFAGRYVGPGGGKLLSRAEAAALHAVGISIVLLAEGFSDDALLGFAKGDEHAQQALAAMNALGVPQDRPCYFSVDFDMTSDQQPQVQAYFLGAAGVMGHNRVGIYGGIRTMNWARANNLALWYYQTAAWSNGQWAPFVHIQQYDFDKFICGATMDLDRGEFLDYGQWPFVPPKPGSAPPPSPPPQGQGPWDYSGTINSIADDVLNNARTQQNWASAIAGLIR